MNRLLLSLLAMLCTAAGPVCASEPPAFFSYLQSERPAMIAFVPTGFDPRRPSGHAPWPADRLHADLRALRPAFDGLVLYDFRPDVTPGILEQASALGYRAVLLGIWDPRSDGEIAGTAELVRRWSGRLALAVVIGNEGINDNRYGIADLSRASERLRALIGSTGTALPMSTSEPAGDYGWPPLLAFGDFLAPNIHPAIDHEGKAPDFAVAWVRARAIAIARLAGRPVLVKETGMPNGGAAAFSAERQRAFWAAWLAAGALAPIEPPPMFVSFAAAFEAFDAQWKAEQLRDPVEGHWGLMSADRAPYPAYEAWVAVAGAR
jgi:exo-beta-1,3-glucanase (GH17 family)